TSPALRVRLAASALKHLPIRQPDRGQHSMFDRIDTDRAPDDPRMRPPDAVGFRIVPVAVHDCVVAAVLSRKVARTPDEGLPGLILNARDAWIQAGVHADTVCSLMVRRQILE